MKHIFAALLLATFSTAAFAQCATTVSALEGLVRHPGFPTSWIETGARDGRPLNLAISNNGSSLSMVFTKGGRPWAHGNGRICGAGNNFTVRIPNITWGEASMSLLRNNRSANFGMVVNSTRSRITVSVGSGLTRWSGTFRPR
jgi:hypothetical protein